MFVLVEYMMSFAISSVILAKLCGFEMVYPSLSLLPMKNRCGPLESF
jgi:hypothetical protein